jgi:hypothetical protein
MKGKKGLACCISVIVFLILFFGFQRLVEPKYADGIPEGNLTAEYYDETTTHDVIMLGDCEVYENLDPMYLWKNYGITSYIRGNSQQLLWQSYYMLEDTLKYETPKVVLLNVQALNYGEPQRETYNRMVLDGMKWSATKFNAIRASMFEDENMLDYVFLILRYHSRITELTASDFKYYFKSKKVAHNGYYMRVDVLPLSESDVADGSWLLGESADDDGEQIDDPWPDSEDAEIDDPWEIEDDDTEIDDPWDTGDEGIEEDAQADKALDGASDTAEHQFAERAMEYLDRIRKLCEENEIKLILMKAPSVSPVWYEDEEQQVLDYVEQYGLDYLNFYNHIDEMALDYETDTYDGGLHMNLSGADKLSRCLGDYLVENYSLEDHRGDASLAEIYDQKYQFYLSMIQEQQEELDTYGQIRMYGSGL